MADNTTLDAGSGGDTIRTEDRSTYKTPVSLIDVGGVASEKILGDASVVFPAFNTVKDGSGTFYCPLVDSDAHLQVDVLSAASTAVTNAGTFAVQVDGDALTALQLIDDAVYTDATGTPSKGVAVMGTDGTNPQLLSCGSDGVLDVDLASSVALDVSAATVTVTGTVTANLGATDNAVLDTIETNTDFGTVVGGGAEATALRVTIANDSTGLVSVDDGGSSLTVDAADLSTIAGAVSGTEMQVDIVTDQPLDRTADNVGVALQTDAMMNDTTALTPKYAAVDAASSGDNTLVAAVAGKKLRVLSAFMVAAGDVLVRFEDGAGGTALTGQMDLTTNGGFVLPFNPIGWFETTANTLLNLELDGAVSVDGSLTYVEV